MALPLEGLKVVDCSRLLPGPYATLLLADLGAQVDKVEDPEGGDYIRQMPPLLGETSALHLGLNRNKRSVVIDLKSKDGVAALQAMTDRADVLVESFRPGVMDRLGLGQDALRKRNPRLIYCSISGFGNTGPDRLKAGHDLGYLARAGVLGYGGEAGGAPAVPGVQIADVGGGSLFAVVGILAALQERTRTGQGRFLDVSMTDGATAFLHMHLAARLAMGPQGTPLSRGVEALNGGYACYGTYRCADGKYLAVGALEPKFFAKLCAALERPELVELGYDTAGGGAAKAKQALQEIFLTRTRDAWAQALGPLDVCVEPVLEGDEVLHDPQLRARGLFVDGGSQVHLKTPLDFGPMPVRPAPALGEHTAQVLTEAGLSQAQVAALTKTAGQG